MRHALWAALVAGCAHAPTVTNEKVVQLPPEARQQIVNAQRAVDVADQNLTAAKIALDDAKQFRDIADRELDAARAHADASQRALDLARRRYADRTLSAARQDREVAMRELFAARAKKDYADRLVDLRRAEVDEKRGELEQTRADVEYDKFAALRQNGMTGNLNETDFVKERERTRTNVAQARGKIVSLTGNVEALRTAWLQRANEYQLASRGVAVPPPPPPAQLPIQPPTPLPPAPGVNEGPSAPQSIPSGPGAYPQY